jgi:hypothetical protein
MGAQVVSDPRDFAFYVEDDLIKVRFVGPKKLGRIPGDKDKHLTGGDYKDGRIRLLRYEYRRTLRSMFLHELGHHLYARQELDRKASEEDICDMLTWLPQIITDKRNKALRQFLGIRRD